MRPYIPWPALIIKGKEKILVIGDLHLGLEASLAESGINLPSQTIRIIKNLQSILDKVKPDRLIIMGDFKHSITKITDQEWTDIPHFLNEITKKIELKIIMGNHDGRLAMFSSSKVNIAPGRGILIENKEKIGLFHGHSWPSPKLFGAKIWVTCHNHPAIQFRTLFNYRILKPIWLKIPIKQEMITESFLKSRHVNLKGKNPLTVMTSIYGINVKCSQLIIMPAFNELLGGLAFNTRNRYDFLGPILRSQGVLLNKAEVFMLDGSYLGLLEELRNN